MSDEITRPPQPGAADPVDVDKWIANHQARNLNSEEIIRVRAWINDRKLSLGPEEVERVREMLAERSFFDKQAERQEEADRKRTERRTSLRNWTLAAVAVCGFLISTVAPAIIGFFRSVPK